MFRKYFPYWLLPRISIITPVLNGAVFLERCLASVRAQRYRNIEHIVIDGGSEDGTIDILKRHHDTIAYWRSEPDRGVYDAMNRGIEVARGDWVLFLGSDDVLYNVLHKVAPCLRDPRSVYYGDAFWEESGFVYGGIFSRERLLEENICHQAIFYPRRVFQKYRYRLDYPVWGDYEFNIRVWSDPEFRFVYLNQTIAQWSAGGLTSRIPEDPVFGAHREEIFSRLKAREDSASGKRISRQWLNRWWHRIRKRLSYPYV